METENDIATKHEMREFLEGLALAELRRLLHTPILSAEILEYAADSEILARRVDEALDAEYQEMSAPERRRMDSAARHIAEEYEIASEAESIMRPKELPPGRSMTIDFSRLPPWLHLPAAPSMHIQLRAQQDSTPGWPFVLTVDAEGSQTPVELKFNWHLSFLVVETPAELPQGHNLFFSLPAMDREFRLGSGSKAILGELETFGLNGSSSEEEIVTALLAAGLTKPKVEKLS